MNLAATLKLMMQVMGTNPLDLVTAQQPFDQTWSLDFTTGAGAAGANEFWQDTRTLADNTSENLDLAGSLTNAFGVTVAFARVKGIAIRNKSTSQVLSVGGAASNAFVNWVADSTDIIKIRPGGIFALWAPDATGYAVTASTGDILKIANGNAGSSTDYDIALLGALT